MIVRLVASAVIVVLIKIVVMNMYNKTSMNQIIRRCGNRNGGSGNGSGSGNGGSSKGYIVGIWLTYCFLDARTFV